jgi:annexin A7/11
MQPGYAQAPPQAPIVSIPPVAYTPKVYPTWENYGRDIAQAILDTDCRALRAAMKGLGTDERAIINILTSRSNAHRFMLKHRYKALLGRDLIKDLKSELSGHFEDVCIALLESPYELDCRSLYEAMARLGTNEATLIEIVATRPTHQLYQDKILFQQLYGKDLVRYVESETSGHFRKVLVAMLQCQRHENDYPINEMELRMDAQRLYQAGVGRWGTDESIFTQIFATRSPVEIAVIARIYQQIAGIDLYTSLKREFSGNVEKLLKAIFYASINTPEWFATRVRNAMEGAGTKDKQLIRIIVSRWEIDLREIKAAYYRLYHRDMVADIRDETSGDYKKILTEICNKC